MARVPLRSQSELPEEYQYLLSEDALGPRNIFRAMAQNLPILQSYMRYGSTLWRESGLDERMVELGILAVARARRSEYEWQQHVELGTEAGVMMEEIRAIGRDDYGAFDGDDRAVIEYARAVALEEVDDATFEALTAQFDARTAVGLTLLAGHYVMTALMLDALAISTESPFVGWEPEESP